MEEDEGQLVVIDLDDTCAQVRANAVRSRLLHLMESSNLPWVVCYPKMEHRRLHSKEREITWGLAVAAEPHVRYPPRQRGRCCDQYPSPTPAPRDAEGCSAPWRGAG